MQSQRENALSPIGGQRAEANAYRDIIEKEKRLGLHDVRMVIIDTIKWANSDPHWTVK